MSRSYLFVPADSERKLAKAAESDADALILDLEDAVAAGARPAARQLIQDFLRDPVRADCWVRINPLDTPDARLDLDAVVPSAPFGVVLPKAAGHNDVQLLDSWLDERERACGDDCGVTRIMPIATERPEALFRMHEYARSSERIDALTWGAEDLGAALGASRTRGSDGRWLPPYEIARSFCLFAAAAAAVPAVDTVYTDFRNREGLEHYASRARTDGFGGMLAIHPAQVEIINQAFSPTSEEVDLARRIVRFFDENPGAGVSQLDGKMIDRPHLLQARRLLEIAARDDAT